MHMLEDHAVEWIKQRNVGIGLLGEQGAESIHARFNTLRIPAKSWGMVEKHCEALLIGIDPNNIVAHPPPAKRRKKTDTSEDPLPTADCYVSMCLPLLQ